MTLATVFLGALLAAPAYHEPGITACDSLRQYKAVWGGAIYQAALRRCCRVCQEKSRPSKGSAKPHVAQLVEDGRASGLRRSGPVASGRGFESHHAGGRESFTAAHPFYREAPVFHREVMPLATVAVHNEPDAHLHANAGGAYPPTTRTERRRSRWPYVIAAGLVVGAVYANRSRNHYEPAVLAPRKKKCEEDD